MTSRTGNKGFTLIEVLVAAVILFAGLGAVLKSYSLAVVAMEAASDKLSACQIMHQKASELELQSGGGSEEMPAGNGRQQAGGFEYSWSVRSDRRVLTPGVSVLQTAIEVNRTGSGVRYALLCEWTQYQEKGRGR